MFFKTPFLIHFWSKTTFNPKNQLSLRIFSQPDYPCQNPRLFDQLRFRVPSTVLWSMVHRSKYNPRTKNDSSSTKIIYESKKDPPTQSDRWVTNNQWIKDLWTTKWSTEPKMIHGLKKWSSYKKWSGFQQMDGKNDYWIKKWATDQKMIYESIIDPLSEHDPLFADTL